MNRMMVAALGSLALISTPALAAEGKSDGKPPASGATTAEKSAVECPPGTTDPLCASENAPGRVLTDEGTMVDAQAPDPGPGTADTDISETGSDTDRPMDDTAEDQGHTPRAE